MGQRTRWRLPILGLLVVGYLLLQRMTALVSGPAITLPAPQDRERFTVDFALPDVHGHPVRLADLRGRPVLINLWATWCHPCRAEMPSLNALYQAYRAQGFAVLAIASDVGGMATVAPFVQEYALTFPVLFDPRNDVGSRLQVPGIPTSYLVDKQGRIAGVEIGARNWNTAPMRQLLEQLLAEEGG